MQVIAGKSRQLPLMQLGSTYSSPNLYTSFTGNYYCYSIRQ